MFGKNEIVGQKYFAETDPDKLFVTSRFMTLQGEGPYRGQPAFFIRLAKCNLACSFCDTFFDDGDWMTFDEIETAIEETIKDYFTTEIVEHLSGGYGMAGREMVTKVVKVPEYAQSAYTTKLHMIDGWIPERDSYVKVIDRVLKRKKMVLVITGGEPMLQKNLGPFLERMEKIFENTQIESNGTLVQDIPKSTTLVVSPKCAEKHGKPTKYLAPKPEMLARADCLKFVMSADPDSPYNTIPDWAHQWAAETGKSVFISPMNIYNSEPQNSKAIRSEKNDIDITERSNVDEVISFWEPGLLDMKANQLNHEYTAKFCIQHGYTFNMQQHLFASLA